MAYIKKVKLQIITFEFGEKNTQSSNLQLQHVNTPLSFYFFSYLQTFNIDVTMDAVGVIHIKELVKEVEQTVTPNNNKDFFTITLLDNFDDEK